MIEYQNGKFGDKKEVGDALKEISDKIDKGFAVRALHIGTEQELDEVKKQKTTEQVIAEIKKEIAILKAQQGGTLTKIPSAEDIKKYGSK